jgi:GTP1/Obg family GTP-binding protein
MQNFKEIKPVLQAKDLIDVVLSRTQRKTPTVVHPQFKISRIRNFYIRKVKYAQTTFREKIDMILTGAKTFFLNKSFFKKTVQIFQNVCMNFVTQPNVTRKLGLGWERLIA